MQVNVTSKLLLLISVQRNNQRILSRTLVAQLLPVTSADAAAEHGIAVAVEINGILSAELLRCFLLAVDLLWIPGAGASLSFFFLLSIPSVNTAMRTAAPVQRRRRQPCMCVRPSSGKAREPVVQLGDGS
jgi:hypothetical protein